MIKADDSLDQRFVRAAREIGINEGKFLVAVSGGPDSTALVELLATNRHELGIDLVLAYVDHSLRGKRASRRERRALYRLGKRHSVRTRIAELNPEEIRRGVEGLEAEARRLRYEALGRISSEEDAKGVIVAHHLDDQVETVLMRLICGTSIEGLAAMRPCLDRAGTTLYRPLLSFRRAELRTVARRSGVKPVRDRSNRDRRRLRSRIRRELLPPLERIRPSSFEAIARLAEESARASDALRAVARSEIVDPCRFERRAFFERAPSLRLIQLHEAVRVASESPVYRIPRRFFAPLLTETDRGLSGRVATGYGVELVLDSETVSVSPISVVRAKESLAVQLFDENGRRSADTHPVPFDSLSFATEPSQEPPVDRSASRRFLFSVEVICPVVTRRASPRDAHAFGQTRAGFKRRIERQPTHFLVLCDGAGPRVLFEVDDEGEISFEMAVDADTKHATTHAAAGEKLAIAGYIAEKSSNGGER